MNFFKGIIVENKFFYILLLTGLLIFPGCQVNHERENDADKNYIHRIDTQHFSIYSLEEFNEPGLIASISNSLEKNCQILTEEMGYPIPFWIADRRLDVRLGGPSKYKGQVLNKPDGEPFIIIHSSFLRGDRVNDWMMTKSVLVHEFFHLIQEDIGAYGEIVDSIQWLMEGSADWVIWKLLSHGLKWDPEQFHSLFLLAPHLAVSFFPGWDVDAGHLTVESFFQMRLYGTDLFLLYLSDYVFDDRFIRDLIINEAGNSDPFLVIEHLAKMKGNDIREIFADFCAWSIHLEGYPLKSELKESIMKTLNGFSTMDFRITAAHEGIGTDWTEVSGHVLPEHHAFNIIKLSNPAKGTLNLGFKGNSLGTLSTPSSFRLRLVREFAEGQSFEVVNISVVNHSANLTVEIGEEAGLYLVVSTWDGDPKTRETFTYKYKMLIENM